MATKNIELFYLHRPVTTLAGLKAIDTTSMVDGVGVNASDLGWYYLDIDSTATPNDITVVQPTVGAGRWLRTDINTFIDQDKIIWVRENGNDSNSGKNIELAKATFAGATAAAVSGDTIVCADGGVYIENLVSKSGVNISATNADIQGNHVITHDVMWKICKNNYTLASGNRFIINAPVHFKLFLDEMIIPAGASGYLTAANSIFDAKVLYQELVDGFLFVDLSAGDASMEFEHIKVTGTATVIAGVISSNVSLRGGVIEDTGSGILISSNSNFHIDATRINMNTLSNIPASATANIICSTMQGTLSEIGLGSANVVSGEYIDVPALTAAGLDYPIADGSANELLKTDGAGVLDFTSNLTVVNVTTDNLTAATLDYPAVDGSANDVLKTDGAGTLSFTDTLTVSDVTTDTLTAASLAYPISDGAANDVLKTDGAGNLAFTDTLDVASVTTSALVSSGLTYPVADASNGYVVKTNGAGTLSLQPDTFTPVDGVQVIWLGKHGNDSNNGKSWEEALLTVDAAISAANTLSPLRANVICLDSGTYTFTATPIILSTVTLYMPNAITTGLLTVESNSYYKCFEHQGNIFLGSAGAASDFARIEIEKMPTQAVNRIFTNSSSVGSFDLRIGEIIGTGLNLIFLDTGTSRHHIKVGTLRLNGGSTIGINVNDGEAILDIGDIVGGVGTTGITIGSLAWCWYSLAGENNTPTQINNSGRIYVRDSATINHPIDDDFVETTSTSSTTNVITLPGTPTDTQGAQFMTRTFPGAHRIGNIIEVEASFRLTASTTSTYIVGALFQQGVTNALAADLFWPTVATTGWTMKLKTQITATSLSAITFNVRGGCSSAATCYFNSDGATQQLGAAQKAWIHIKEIEVN